MKPKAVIVLVQVTSNDALVFSLPRPSSYPLLGPKYPLLETIYPQLRVQGTSWYKSKYPIIRSTEPVARPKGEPGKVWQDVGEGPITEKATTEKVRV